MSGIQLSQELVENLQAVMANHDPDTAKNDLLFMQYLSAVVGFLLAHQTQPGLDKQAFLGDISTFMGQVLNQVETDMRESQAPQEDAFGVWKPE